MTRPTVIALSDPQAHPLVDAFYADLGYGGRVSPTDQVLVASEGPDIVGVLRLCEEGGELVLRGVYVRHDLRGCGIGSAMLRRIEDLIGVRPCWCVPHSHLVDFYGRIGFQPAPAREIPQFLSDRETRYREQGLDVVIMVRRV